MRFHQHRLSNHFIPQSDAQPLDQVRQFGFGDEFLMLQKLNLILADSLRAADTQPDPQKPHIRFEHLQGAAEQVEKVLRIARWPGKGDRFVQRDGIGAIELDLKFPRSMTWQLVKCPDTGAIVYEFQSGAHEYWTSLWVRNARVPIARVEVQSANHAQFVELTRAGDGTLTDASGFGVGPFTLRVTGVDGSQITDSFTWPAGGVGGARLTGAENFP